MNSVQYLALADWMWLREKWLVRRIAFAPVYKPEDTLVVSVKKESWGMFTFEEVQKNTNLHPLSGFLKSPSAGESSEWTWKMWPLSSGANFTMLF
ncbi:hypothetical protein AVEN_186786-1 [Araneus ventricosus]|uniref:Uncharacterized protein n=1 Tax=Araneus ventricosus TaxID=182803 RepID=A0A4Y2UP38_ARAVE|nr:hypothetical protein AVEN_186786-1 [Araneus ventricosus]